MNIRLMNVALLLSVASAFAPIKLATTTTISTTSTSLMMEPSSWSRRDLMTHGLWIAGILTTLEPTRSANAFDQQLDPYEVVSSQQYTGGKIDLNSAFVVSFHWTEKVGRIRDHDSHHQLNNGLTCTLLLSLFLKYLLSGRVQDFEVSPI